MAMRKEVVEIIANLNSLYDELYKEWPLLNIREKNFKLKLDLIKKVAKQLEEKERWFLKTTADYKTMAEIIIKLGKEKDFDSIMLEIKDLFLV